MAVVIMILPAIAAEDVSQDDTEAVSASDDVAVTVTETDDASDSGSDDEIADETEEGEAAGETTTANAVPAPSGFLMDLPSADLAVEVTPEYQTAKAGDLVSWIVTFMNYGPDEAENTIANINILKGDIFYLGAICSYFNPFLMDEPQIVDSDIFDQLYNPVTGEFDIGTMLPGDIISVYVTGLALSDGEAILGAKITSDTYDPDLSNNVAFGYVNYAGEAAAAEKTLPATGNPIVMVLLALISIVGVTFSRKL